jgi:site-specific DNA-methyltransferase (adenine-specific)
MKDWPDNCVDLVLTDPPFKVSQKYGGGVDADNLMAVSSIFQTIPEVSRILKPNRFFATFYDNRILPVLFQAIKGTILTYRKQIYLYRRWGNAHRWVGWMQCTDPICIFVNGYDKPFAPKLQWQVKHDCYIKDSPEEYNSGHPAQKPLEILRDIIAWCSNSNDIVLDPYCGSGGTLFAAAELCRRYIGIDISEKYCEIARQRLEAVDTGVPVKEQRAGQMALFKEK